MKDSIEIVRASAALGRGGLIAMPTDTLYALAADATDDNAVERIYRLKVRERGKPLPLFVASLSQALAIADFNQTARALAEAFWPGALTIVLPKQSTFKSRALAGSDSVALRVPNEAQALAILQKLGRPLTGTSANLSGGPDPVSAADVRRQLGDGVDLILEAQTGSFGRSSTIVDCTGPEPRVLRQGAISAGDIEAVLGTPLVPASQ